MEVSCTSCPARFAVPDDKVRGKKVRIKCKRCGGPIVVDGTSLAAAPGAAAAAAAKPAPAAAAKPAPAPVAAPKPAPSPAAAAKPAPAPAAAAKPAPAAAAKPAPTKAAPQPAAAKSPASAPKPEWSALGEAGKSTAWREPAKAAATDTAKPAALGVGGPTSVPRPGAAPRPAPAPAAAPAPTASVKSSAKRTMLGGLEPPPQAAPAPAPQASARRTMLGIPAPAPASAPLPPVAPAAAPAPGQAAAGGSDASELEPEWTVALTDDQHEEMRTGEVVELYARGTIDHETFIWADGMEDWKQPWEIPLISVALAARGLSMPAEGEEYSDMAMQEPEHDDATVVASFRFGPPSSRGKMSSGVWHEPGRAEVEEVGFDDVTMSVDSHRARQMLQQATREAGPNADDIQYGAPPSEMPPRGEMRSVEEDVDDLIAGLDEPTVAAPSAFQAESRPLSDWPTSVDTQAVQPPDSSFDQDEQATTIEQRPTGARNVDSVLFSLDNLLQSPPSSSHPVAPQAERDLFADLPSGIPAAHADQPLDAAFGGPQSSRQGPAYGAPVSAAVPSERKRGSGCIWVLLIAVVLLGAAGAGAWYFQQPAMLWKDGRLNLPVSW